MNLTKTQYVKEVSEKFLRTLDRTNPLKAYLDTLSKIYNDPLLMKFEVCPYNIMDDVMEINLSYTEYDNLENVLEGSGIQFKYNNS